MQIYNITMLRCIFYTIYDLVYSIWYISTKCLLYIEYAICMLYNVDIIVLVLCSSTIEYIPKENLDYCL